MLKAEGRRLNAERRIQNTERIIKKRSDSTVWGVFICIEPSALCLEPSALCMKKPLEKQIVSPGAFATVWGKFLIAKTVQVSLLISALNKHLLG